MPIFSHSDHLIPGFRAQLGAPSHSPAGLFCVISQADGNWRGNLTGLQGCFETPLGIWPRLLWLAPSLPASFPSQKEKAGGVAGEQPGLALTEKISLEMLSPVSCWCLTH